MANFEPSKKTAQDFHNGVEYVSGDGTTTGDMVQAETINNLVESALYTQDQADTAVQTAQDAKDLVESVVQGVSVPPAVGLHHIQYNGEPTPAQIWAGTTWEIDTAYQGKTIIGSGGDYTLGATGGSATHSHESGNIHALGTTQSTGFDVRLSQSVGDWLSTHYIAGSGSNTTSINHRFAIETNGSTANATVLPPYTVVNFWKRTA